MEILLGKNVKLHDSPTGSSADYLQISEYFLYLLKVDIQEASGDDPDGADTNPPPCWLTGHTHTHTLG